MSTDRVWFITGTSTGFGRHLAELVLQKGEKVVATARRPSVLDDLVSKYPSDQLLVLKVDVNVSQDIVDAFAATKDKFGRIDVVVNNAAYAVMGELEAVSEEEARKLFDTNFWGAMCVSREAVKFFREVNAPGVGGRLLQISSITGLIGGAGMTYYAASKHALEGASECLAAELDPAWNIKITIVEPASFHTEGQAKTTWVPAHPAYSNPELPASRMRNGWGTYSPPGDVRKAVEVIYKVASLPEPPLHFLLGENAIMYARKKLADLAADTNKYESWSEGLKKNP
ncbi:NAD-P-binding protein [Lentinus tigrinus ALCF2SS1-7]|uniref:NAD-P-binding protein n=1 Tax=Lentinus tigrinus ALCF2SS1-6 TaxID=1328759 RepID=A0A5C2S1Q2_9APHY|nr:NAD-P-binding protein [Lentinus tigrinus ALCF2SS1-6]RPD71622.1 NAD-P-binding protein [Lentinus tigrinus ALCF2SS1-7]